MSLNVLILKSWKKKLIDPFKLSLIKKINYKKEYIKSVRLDILSFKWSSSCGLSSQFIFSD